MSVLPELLAANERYAREFTKGDLPNTPARQVAIITCMDARLDPTTLLGLQHGDAHVIRNAGGRVTEDVIRSLIVSHYLGGTREFIVISHTECAMTTFTNEQLNDLLLRSTGMDSGIDFIPIRELEQSVREDVERIRSSSLIPEEIPVSGFIYDVRTGRLHEVGPATTDAMAAG